MMEPSELRGKLNGVIAFPVTPFKADLSLDIDGLRKNVAEMAEFPMSAIVAAGGTGGAVASRKGHCECGSGCNRHDRFHRANPF